MLVDTLVVGIWVYPLHEFVECVEVQSQIQIVDKCLFLVSDVDNGSIQGRKNLLHFSEIYISYGKAVTLAGLLVQLDQLVVLHQGYRDFR